ncbi:hypothetical protein SBV1_190054 [Verrucomicrobia bacterium]|nr:hypothetical protein SBV1_190054 [Verrucomicrobiota bacterium]
MPGLSLTSPIRGLNARHVKAWGETNRSLSGYANGMQRASPGRHPAAVRPGWRPVWETSSFQP